MLFFLGENLKNCKLTAETSNFNSSVKVKVFKYNFNNQGTEFIKFELRRWTTYTVASIWTTNSKLKIDEELESNTLNLIPEM